MVAVSASGFTIQVFRGDEAAFFQTSSRGKIHRQKKRLCQHPAWLKHAAVVTGFAESEVSPTPPLPHRC